MRWVLLGGELEADELERRFASKIEVQLARQAVSDWESLLVRNDVDAVFVTRGLDEALRTEQLKKIVGSGIPVIASHPAVDVLTAYELEVIRRDASGSLIAYAPGWEHPAWDVLCDMIATGAESPLGRIEHVSFERDCKDRQRGSVLAQLSQDVHILRRLLANITSINAVGDSRNDGTWNSLTVHFASDSGRSANWSLAPVNSTAESHVRLVGSQGSASLRIPTGSENSKWELRNSAGLHQVFENEMDPDRFVAKFHAMIIGNASFPSWSEICLDLEVAEAVERSLRRKRAIDLYTANRSEEKTFKGFMAAIGCLVLVAILLGFFVLALWDGFRSPFRDPVGRRSATTGDGWPLWLRLWPVYPLLAFLLLQFLLLLTRRPSSKSNAESVDTLKGPADSSKNPRR